MSGHVLISAEGLSLVVMISDEAELSAERPGGASSVAEFFHLGNEGGHCG